MNQIEKRSEKKDDKKRNSKALSVFIPMILPLLSAVDVVVTALLSSHAENVPVTCPSFCMKK